MKIIAARVDPAQWSWTPFNPDEIRDQESIASKLVDGWSWAVRTNYKPSKVRQKVVLCFSIGLLNFGLLDHFCKTGLKYFFLDYDQLSSHGTLSWLIDDRASLTSLAIGEAELDLSDVCAVLWEPPDYVFIPDKKVPFQQELFLRRWWYPLLNLRHMLSNDVLWLPSHPENGSQEYQRKVGEYRLAGRLNLKVPKTLITNDPDEAFKFYSERRVSTLLREFSFGKYSFPLIFLAEDLKREDFSDVRWCPCTFQEFIPKVGDVRAVVIGDKVHAFFIDSQASSLAERDWRVHDDANVSWSRYNLPEDVAKGLVDLCYSLGLAWGSADFAVGQDGNHYFLEVNRPGALRAKIE